MEESRQYPVWPGWETVRLIGRGSFGAVYEIRREVFGDTEYCALKHISIPQSENEIREMRGEGQDEESISRSLSEQAKEVASEYKLMLRLSDCPNVVRCHDVDCVRKESGLGWDVFIRMELLKPLIDLLSQEQDFSEKETIRLGRDTANALVACRRLHIIHRDIKPQNIFLAGDGSYKLGDFGIARIAEKTGTATARIGTFTYMAPEVFKGERYGAQADIYSLGMMLYWLLNERRGPFVAENTPREKEAALNRRMRGEHILPPAHGSPELKRIVLKACAYDPKDRYRSAMELLEDLNRADADAECGGRSSKLYENTAVSAAEAGVARPPAENDEIRSTGTPGAAVSRPPAEEQGSGPNKAAGAHHDVPGNSSPDAGPLARDDRNGDAAEGSSAAKEEAGEALPGTGSGRRRVSGRRTVLAVLAVLLGTAALVLFLLRPRYGPWTEWSTEFPEQIEWRKIEKSTEYRCRRGTLMSTTDREQAPEEIDRQTMEYAAWGEYSDWQEEPIPKAENREVYTTLQYAVRNRETMSSGKENLEGWTLVEATTEMVWSGFQECAAKPEASETRQVREKTQYHCYLQEYYPNGEFLRTEYDPDWSDAMTRGNAGTRLEFAGGFYGIVYYDTRTVYSYSDLLPKTTYHYYRWGEWSDWSNEAAEENENQQVKTRTLYCCREKVQIPVYYYYVWSDWSAWSMTPVAESDAVKVETRPVYRYTDRQN